PNSRFVINIPHDSRKAPAGNVIKNNILYTPDSNHGSVLIAAKSVSGFESDYNVVVNNLVGLTKWQALGFDLHSVIAAPAQLFVDPANNNYALKAGSPAIDGGVALPQVPTDILGVTRPQGLAYDIGAYEFVASTPVKM